MLGSAQAHFRSNGLSATGARQLLEALPAEATVEGMEGSTHKTMGKPLENVSFTSKNWISSHQKLNFEPQNHPNSMAKWKMLVLPVKMNFVFTWNRYGLKWQKLGVEGAKLGSNQGNVRKRSTFSILLVRFQEQKYYLEKQQWYSTSRGEDSDALKKIFLVTLVTRDRGSWNVWTCRRTTWATM